MATTNLQLYSNIVITVDNKVLTQATSVSVDRMNNSIAQKTIVGGYSGESPGAAMCEVSVDNAVPSAEFEFDPGPFIKANQKVSFTVYAAGSMMRFDGFIISDNFSYAVDSASKLTFKARGSFSEYKPV